MEKPRKQVEEELYGDVRRRQTIQDFAKSKSTSGSDLKLENAKKRNETLAETNSELLQSLDCLHEGGMSINRTSTNLKDVKGEYNNHQSRLRESKQHIKDLDRQARLNNLMIYGSFYFLILVVCYIVLKRIPVHRWIWDILMTTYGQVETLIDNSEQDSQMSTST
mmetsp:Transcript_8725/g.9448  ORF Transcript_8725/g.9448 Transcript_8725/m.9448 type:complete len:165 (+) Transcript_8725:132-626(+)